MKKLLFLMVAFFAINSYSAGPSCGVLFDKTVVKETGVKTETEQAQAELREALEELSPMIEQIQGLRKKINFWQNLTGEAGRKALAEARMHRKYFNFLFENAQDAVMAIEQYRDVFMDVEYGWFKLSQIEIDKKNGTNKVSAADELKFKKAFAQSYGDYRYVRGMLEGLKSRSEENASLAKRAEYVLESLGAPSFASSFKNVKVVRPSNAQIQDYFRAHPELLMLKLKSELSLQRKYALKLVPLTLTQVENIQKLIIRAVPQKLRGALGALIGLNYNSYVLKRYLDDVETVINTPNEDMGKKFEVLRVMADKKHRIEFLTTFARITNYSDSWISLKKVAEEKSGEPIMGKFFEDMKKAEELAIKADNNLTPFYKPSFIDHLRVWIAPATTVIATHYSAKLLEVTYASITGAQTFMTSLGM